MPAGKRQVTFFPLVYLKEKVILNEFFSHFCFFLLTIRLIKVARSRLHAVTSLWLYAGTRCLCFRVRAEPKSLTTSFSLSSRATCELQQVSYFRFIFTQSSSSVSFQVDTHPHRTFTARLPSTSSEALRTHYGRLWSPLVRLWRCCWQHSTQRAALLWCRLADLGGHPSQPRQWGTRSMLKYVGGGGDNVCFENFVIFPFNM